MQRNLERFDAAAEDMRVGKLSGAVGTFGHLEPEHEERICARLGLSPHRSPRRLFSATATRHYIATLASSAARWTKLPSKCATCSGPKCARPGVFQREAEGLLGDAAQTKSDHQRADQRPGAGDPRLRQAALENVPLWHERDISHSSVERVIFPDSTILADYLLAKTTDLIDRLLVYPERMKKNLESTGGLIFSGQLLLDLAEAGMLREDAYRLVQGHAMRAWKEDLVFRDEVAKDPQSPAC